VTDVFFRRLCNRANLFAAWRHVKGRALKSPAREIRNTAEEFDVNAFSNIQSIQSRLSAKTFKFPPAEGILKDKVKRERAGKMPRPIVIADIQSRIVQRALLQCLQPKDDDVLSKSIGRVREINNSTVNFGGTPSGGVPKAIYRVTSCMKEGYSIFYKSDIGSFFTKVPHEVILNFLFGELQDEEFIRVFADGLNVQLRNAERLNEYLGLFPDNEIGVAQGSSLSAFAGNVFLQDVDLKFQNMPDVSLVRYIDDVVLLGKSNDHVQEAKSRLAKELRRKGLSLYDPAVAPDKAAEGHVRNGFEYLGCALRPGQVEPSKKARANLLSKIDSAISDAKENINKFQMNAALTRNRQATFSQTIANIDDVIRGWSNSFRFVTNRLVFSQIDKQIIHKIFQFQDWVSRLAVRNEAQRARIMGLYQVHDVDYKSLEELAVKSNGKKVGRMAA
jgi:RNA-directed DNA polymerase